jgi:hypothetical protein
MVDATGSCPFSMKQFPRASKVRTRSFVPRRAFWNSAMASST